jgi:hypothetical protein
MHRARIAEKPVSSESGPEEHSGIEPVASGQNTQPREQVDISIDENQQSSDPYTDETITHLQEAFAEAKREDYQGEDKGQYDAQKRWDAWTVVTLNKYSKKVGEYEKKIEYVPMKLSDTETLYTGKGGEYCLVRKLPSGEVAKTQMQDVDGELQPVGEEKVYAPQAGEGKSGGDSGK